MKYTIRLAGLTAIVAGIVACGGATSSSADAELTVQGTVSEAVTVDNARAVAIGHDGRTFWTYLDAHRDFTLRLPVGQSYRILITNARASGGSVSVGHLSFRNGASQTAWLGANAEGTVDLGAVQPAAGAMTTIMCNACGGDHDDGDAKKHGDDDRKNSSGKNPHDDDNACHEKGKGKEHKKHHDHDDPGEHADAQPPKPRDHDGDDDDDDDDCDEDKVCDGGSDRELEPSHQPGDRCEDKDDHHGDHVDPCGGGGGGGGGSDGGAGDGGVDAGGGGGAVGSECLATANCASGLVCVAGVCRTPGGGVVGSECLSTAECSLGLVCAAGICAQPSGGAGSECLVSATCSTGLICVAGICSAPTP